MNLCTTTLRKTYAAKPLSACIGYIISDAGWWKHCGYIIWNITVVTNNNQSLPKTQWWWNMVVFMAICCRTTIVVVGGWPRVVGDVVVAASVYLCLPCFLGGNSSTSSLLRQRPGTIGIVWTSSMDHVEVALTTCRSNNQLSIWCNISIYSNKIWHLRPSSENLHLQAEQKQYWTWTVSMCPVRINYCLTKLTLRVQYQLLSHKADATSDDRPRRYF